MLQHDGEQVWSGEPCELGHLSAAGGTHRGSEACPDVCSVQDCVCPAECYGDSDSHAVRCCADVLGSACPNGKPVENPACSSLTCAELADAYGEWPIDNTCTDQDSVDVCAESDAGIGQYSLLDPTRDKACLGGITDTDQGDDEITDGWVHAATICSAIGARLCSVAELQADETRCTGCQVPIVACTLILTVN